MKLLACLSLAAAVAVSACGGVGSAAQGPCPKVAVLPDAANYPVKDANGNVVALARLSVANTPCIYNTTRVDETGFGSLNTTLNVVMVGAREGRRGVDTITAPVVVATVTDDGIVTGRRRIEMEVDLDSEGTGRSEEKLSIRMGFKGNGPIDKHRIIVAFALDRQDILLNRSQIGR